MRGKRQNIQYSLALELSERGETLVGGYQGTEPPVAKPDPESPALAEQLMEEMCGRENCETAWKHVRKNKGGPGVDGMTIDEAADYLREHWPSIRSQLLDGPTCTWRAEPQPVKRVALDERPGEDGGPSIRSPWENGWLDGTHQPQPVKRFRYPSRTAGSGNSASPVSSTDWSSKPCCRFFRRNGTRRFPNTATGSARGARPIRRWLRHKRILLRATVSWLTSTSKNSSTVSTRTD